MPNFVKSEQQIIDLFPKGTNFTFDGKTYTVIACGKPRPFSGECKVDVYICGKAADGEIREIKISVKQNNADFLENKMSLSRAKEIFGEKAQEIIGDCLKSIEDMFISDYLVCFDRYGRTESHTMKLGWKFELINKLGGLKSGEMALTDEQKYDIFAGINLPPDKKNSRVDGVEIENSGVANYIIELDGQKLTMQKCLNSLQPIKEYAKKQTIYFACKALNYRFDKCKWDGARPLAVYVDWSLNDGKLDGKLVFDKPLSHDGNEIGENLRVLLKQLEIERFEDLKSKLSSNVKYYSQE